MIGTRPPLARSPARMATVASSPLISGICTSISTTSKLSRSNAATAARPSPASTTSCPRFVSIRVTRSWFTALSSADEHAQPRPRVGRPVAGAGAALASTAPQRREDRASAAGHARA